MDETGAAVNHPTKAPEAAAPLPLIAIIGRANVGKSTLFNRLARNRRALVEDRPGVTRDRVVSPARLEDRPVLLVDTGGLDPDAERGIPAAVAAQVRRAIEDAAVILLVVDARDGLLPLDREIANLLRRAGRQIVLVANKVDGPRQEAAADEFHALGLGEPVTVSAEHKRGIVDLEITVAERLEELKPESTAESDEGSTGESEEAPAVRLAVIGRPNVGKSSLVNQLAGEAHAIVSDQPGTTRDATDLRLRVGERDVILIDTAGLRRPGRRAERIERGSAFMALRSVERADVAILLLDAAEGVTDQDAKIARLALDRGRPLVVALNKWDTVGEAAGAKRAEDVARSLERRLGFVRDPVVLRTSALNGMGTQEALEAALTLHDEGNRLVSTSELNRVLEEAVARNQPPAAGRRRPRFYYATQVSARPFTVLVFTSDPQAIPANYQRYLESFFRKRFGIRSAPVRVRLRARPRNDSLHSGA